MSGTDIADVQKALRDTLDAWHKDRAAKDAKIAALRIELDEAVTELQQGMKRWDEFATPLRTEIAALREALERIAAEKGIYKGGGLYGSIPDLTAIEAHNVARAALHKDGFPNEAESVVEANELRAAEVMRAKTLDECEAIARDLYIIKGDKAWKIADAIAALKDNGERK